MARIAYYRVSARDQSVAAQRAALGGSFDREFADEGVSGAVVARNRPGFAALLDYVREGDTLYVHAVDRLGRDAIDVQSMVRELLAKRVVIDIAGIGVVEGAVGRMVVGLLSQFAELERGRIRERAEAGRSAARQSLERTGKTHRGKPSLGRTPSVDPVVLNAWRRDHNASAARTAEHFQVSLATVKRCSRKRRREEL